MIPESLRCLYLHGFKSSALSAKAQQMLAFFEAHNANLQISVPNMPPEPAQGMAMAEVIYREFIADVGAENCLLVGSSLGGYYARYLLEKHGGSSVLINPSIRPFELLSAYIGTNENYHTGETFEVTEAFMDQLLALNIEQLSYPERCLLLQQTGDETLDYREASEKYITSPCIIEAGGDHSYQGFEHRIPTILQFAQRVKSHYF